MDSSKAKEAVEGLEINAMTGAVGFPDLAKFAFFLRELIQQGDIDHLSQRIRGQVAEGGGTAHVNGAVAIHGQGSDPALGTGFDQPPGSTVEFQNAVPVSGIEYPAQVAENFPVLGVFIISFRRVIVKGRYTGKKGMSGRNCLGV